MKFNKDTKIGEIMEVAPEKAEILLGIGMLRLSSITSRDYRRSMWGSWCWCRRTTRKIKCIKFYKKNTKFSNYYWQIKRNRLKLSLC